MVSLANALWNPVTHFLEGFQYPGTPSNSFQTIANIFWNIFKKVAPLSCQEENFSVIYLWKIKYFFFSYIFLGFFFVYTEYLCRPSEANTRYCAILGSNPPKE